MLSEIPQIAFIDNEGICFHDNNLQQKGAEQAPRVTFTAKKQLGTTQSKQLQNGLRFKSDTVVERRGDEDFKSYPSLKNGLKMFSL